VRFGQKGEELCLTDLLEEGLIERVAHIHASGDEGIEDGFHLRDYPPISGFLEHAETSHHGDALALGFSSGFAFINEEGSLLFVGQRDGLALSKVESGRELVKERAVTHGETPNPR